MRLQKELAREGQSTDNVRKTKRMLEMVCDTATWRNHASLVEMLEQEFNALSMHLLESPEPTCAFFLPKVRLSRPENPYFIEDYFRDLNRKLTQELVALVDAKESKWRLV
jgi:hypothetical protein